MIYAIVFVSIIILSLVIGLRIKRGPLPVVNYCRVDFNGEPLNAGWLLIDKRSNQQKKQNLKSGKLDGEVIIFMHGHAQRPNDGYALTSLLAECCKSGLVIVPVVNTPYGLESQWHGDQGKMEILMAISRHVLQSIGISVQNFQPFSNLELQINGSSMGANDPQHISAGLLCIGWSHGGILVRRFANAFPQSVRSIAQLAPAGFESWGANFLRTPYLLINFLFEVLLIGEGLFKGQYVNTIGPGWGLVKGIWADTTGAFYSNLKGNFNFLKFFRALKDLEQASLVLNDDNCPTRHLHHLAVIYGIKDTTFEPDKAYPIKDLNHPSAEEINGFWQKFYPGAFHNNTSLSFKIMPGNHVGPLVYSEHYVQAVLGSVNQMKIEN